MLAVIREQPCCIHALMQKLSEEEKTAYLKYTGPCEVTALIGAIQCKKIQSIDTLLNFCNSFFSKSDYIQFPNRENGNNALHIAIEMGDVQVVRTLLKHIQHNVNELKQCLQAKNRWGSTALHIAVNKGDPECTQLIIDTMREAKVDLGISNIFGETALHYAVDKKNTSLVHWFSEHAPALLKKADLYSYTPLDLCLAHKQTEFIPNSQNHPLYGRLPISINQGNLKTKIIAFLTKKERLGYYQLHYSKQSDLPPGFAWNQSKKCWEIPGLCQGLSVLYAYYAAQGKDVYFHQVLEAIASWDETQEALQKPLEIESPYTCLDELMEQWINDIFWFQHDDDSTPFTLVSGQGDIQTRFELASPFNETLKQEGSLQLQVHYEQMEELIQLLRYRNESQFLFWGFNSFS